ncbi:MAG: hypothetical protein AB7U61_12785 [Methylocystis sp.]
MNSEIDNSTRAALAETALEAYAMTAENRLAYDVPEDMAADLICDLLHFIRSTGADPTQKARMAMTNFEAEETES